jgi:putative glycosyltransferase
MRLSIVSTLYMSSNYIQEFYERISKEAKKITDDYEIILVDDGSPDDSLQKAVALQEKDAKVKVIELSRNFGHHKAMMTGLRYTRGDYVFLIDSDLEEEPELLGRFWDEMQKNDDVDVVYGVQKRRKGNWFEKISGEIFWRIFKRLSGFNVPANMVTARMTTNRYNNELIKYRESEFFIGGVWIDVGFKQKPIYIQKKSINRSTYTVKKKISMLVNSITSFSSKPLIYIFYLGLIITTASFIYIAKLLFDKILYNTTVEGWTSLIVSVWFFGGLIILILGIIGIYLSKVFIETKNRPFVIIKNIYSIEREKK